MPVPAKSFCLVFKDPSAASQLRLISPEFARSEPEVERQIALLKRATSVRAIGCTGLSRAGKSHFNNKIQDLLSGNPGNSAQIFKSSAGAETCTQGIMITVTGELDGPVTVLIDTEGIGNSEGPLNLLDSQLCVAFLASSTHVSISACDFRDEAFAVAARVAVAGVDGTSTREGTNRRILLDFRPGNHDEGRNLTMISNKWVANSNPDDFFRERFRDETNPVHATNVAVLQRTYGASISIESIQHFGISTAVELALRDPASPVSREFYAVAERVISRTTAFKVESVTMTGAMYWHYLGELVDAVNASLRENNNRIRVPGALSSIQATCDAAVQAAMHAYVSPFAGEVVFGQYLPPAVFVHRNNERRQLAINTFVSRTSQWRDLPGGSVADRRQRLDVRLGQAETHAQQENAKVGLQPIGNPWTEERVKSLSTQRLDYVRKSNGSEWWNNGRLLQKQRRRVQPLKNGSTDPNSPEVGWVDHGASSWYHEAHYSRDSYVTNNPWRDPGITRVKD